VASSQFGAFTGLKATHSSSSDIYPNTHTFLFDGSTCSSASLDFVPVELATNQEVGDSIRPSRASPRPSRAMLDAYDRPPYTSEAGAIPFIDISNRFVTIGASYNSGVLQSQSITQSPGRSPNRPRPSRRPSTARPASSSPR
jgi:hypothetical protein